MFRGPGTVTFDNARVPVPKQGAMITSSATFSAPGEYLLRVQANDESGEGGFVPVFYAPASIAAANRADCAGLNRRITAKAVGWSAW
jgi:hypothetical protein